MSEIQSILTDNNPFFSGTHPDPWVRQFQNISSINGEVFSSVTRIIRNKQEKPFEPVGILIKGEAGFGKSHMIARIREYCEETRFENKFSVIKPIIDPQTPLRRLLKGIITNLAHPISDRSRCTQIHELIFSMICDYYSHKPDTTDLIRNFSKDSRIFFKILISSDEKRRALFRTVYGWILEEIPAINPLFIRLLFSFGNNHLQRIAYLRLTGEIADGDDAKKLRIPFQESLSEPAMEEEAREFLISLGLLLSRYNQSMIICFDQLENLHTTELIRAFGLIIQTIINDCRSLIPLAFMRTLHWDETFCTVLDQSVIEKLGMNQFVLRGCTDHEVEEIIKTRLTTIFPDHWQEPYSWLIAELKKSIHKNPSPREVIRSANAIITMVATPGSLSEKLPVVHGLSPSEVIKSAFMNEHDQILSDMESWPPDYEELSEATCVYLTARKYPINRNKLARKTILTINRENNRCCIIINTNPNHSAVGSGFTKGTLFLHENQGSSCIYLTDPRCIITKPGWKQVKQKKDLFLASGGIILQPSEGDIARYYALYSLCCKITEGDIQIETDSGIRPIHHDEVLSFIGDPGMFSPLFSHIPKNEGGKKGETVYPSDKIHQALCQILTHASMHIMRADHISQKLNEMGFCMTYDDLIIWCGQHKDFYKILQSQKGSMIILQGHAAVCSPAQ